MRLVDVRSAAGKMRRAVKQLRIRWQETQEHWHDPVSAEFEERRLQELERCCIQAIDSIERLSNVLVQAEKECSQ
jgi:hypothetical protein